MTKKFDGPIDLNDIKTPPLSPYSQTTFQPYDPIISEKSNGPSLASILADEKELLSRPSKQRHQRILLVLIITAVVFLFHLVYYYESLAVSYNPNLIKVFIGSLSAVLAQLINQFYKKIYNVSHIVKFFVWGSINGVLTSLWIEMLLEYFPNLIFRVLFDQLVGSPLFQLVYLVLGSLWDNHDVATNLRVHYFRSLKLSYLIWPSFSILSFSILPVELIFPCNCLVSLIWNVILSFLT